jgi:hypothetical protein
MRRITNVSRFTSGLAITVPGRASQPPRLRYECETRLHRRNAKKGAVQREAGSGTIKVLTDEGILTA